MRSGERSRPSLSHAAAVGDQVDIEDAIAASKREESSRNTLAQLAAPPSAQKRVSKLRAKNKLGEMLGYMVPPKKKRSASPPPRREATSSAPTPERQAKEPDYGKKVAAFHSILHAGGQVAHQTRVFTDVYDRHIPDRVREAFDLLLRGYEIAQRARSTSSRAYTGAPYTGQSPDMDGHVALTDQDRRDLELFAYSWQELVAQTSEWADRLQAHVLRVADERSGKLQSVHELGAARTGYAKGSDNAQAAGVMGVLDAGLRWLEAVQAGALKLQYARMRRRAVHEEEAARYALGEKERRVRDLAHEKAERVTSYALKIAAGKKP